MAAPYVVPALASSSGVGPTRRALRRALADELGELAVLTLTATPSSAVTPDADRQVLALAIGSDGLGPGYFDGGYVYVVDGVEAGETRRILDGTFDGAISSLLLDRPFSSPLASGTEVELTRPLPGGRHLTTKGLNQIVDEALALIKVLVRLPITGNGTREHDFAAYPWVTAESQILGLYDTRFVAGDVLEASPYAVRWVADGVGRTLVTAQTYSASETFEVAAIGPADRLVYDGTEWGYATTPGLQDETYQAAAPLRWVKAFAMTKALEYLLAMTERDERLSDAVRDRRLAGHARRYEQWAATAADIKLNGFEKGPMEPARPLASVLSSRRWR